MKPIVLGAAVVAAILVLYIFDPAGTAWFPSCPLHAWTGWACPGCGTLRAAHALLHLRIGEALRDNALAIVIGSLGLAGFVRRRQAVWTTRWLAVILAFGVIRNIPVRPFIWLLP